MRGKAYLRGAPSHAPTTSIKVVRILESSRGRLTLQVILTLSKQYVETVNDVQCLQSRDHFVLCKTTFQFLILMYLSKARKSVHIIMLVFYTHCYRSIKCKCWLPCSFQLFQCLIRWQFLIYRDIYYLTIISQNLLGSRLSQISDKEKFNRNHFV